jgi:hypothetical protein
MAHDTFDQFVTRMELQYAHNSLRSVSHHPKAYKYERYFLECPDRGEDRLR